MSIKHFVKKRLPFVVDVINNIRFRERRVSYGSDNADKIFYVIGQTDYTGGLWWQVNKVIMHIGYAEEKGYIPVVDLLNNKTQYSESDNENVWEKFFLQPAGYSMADIHSSKNIIINKIAAWPQKKYMMGQNEFYDCPDRIEYFRNLFHKYIHFNDHTNDILESRRNSIIPREARVVGVLCRGTDYVVKKPKGHPIQPNAKDVIVEVKNIMQNFNCNYVFLATEDQDIYDEFKASFSDSLLAIEQTRISKNDINKDMFLSRKLMENHLDTYSIGVDYMTATYILSKCDCFISGRTGGCKGVLLMTKGFEYCKIYNLGLYK